MSLGASVESSANQPIRLVWHGVAFQLDLAACRQSIVEHMLAEGLQLHTLALKADVSRMSLWRFMQGQQCSAPTVSKILRAADLDPKAVLHAMALEIA